jgi:hypothetical protein
MNCGHYCRRWFTVSLLSKKCLSTLVLLSAFKVLCEPRLQHMQSSITLRDLEQLVDDVNNSQAYFCNFKRAIHNIAVSWVPAKGATLENLLSV